MRFIIQIKKTANEVVDYVFYFSKGQAAAGLGAGAGTVFYVGAGLKKFIGNIPAFSIGIVGGTIVGIVTVYRAEKENKKLIAEIIAAIEAERSQCQELHRKYLKMKGKHEALDTQQITNQTTTKIFSILENIFKKMDQPEQLTRGNLEKKSDIIRVDTFSSIRGDIRSRPEDPLENICLTFNSELVEESKEADVSFPKKIFSFIRNSKAFPRAIMASYLAMISYYLELSLEEIAGVNNWLAWPISVILATIASPIIVYATSEPSRTKLASLRSEHAFFSETKSQLQAGVENLQTSLDGLNSLITSPENYQTLLAALSQQDSKIVTPAFLKEILHKFNKKIVVKRATSISATSPLPSTSTNRFSILSNPSTPLLLDNKNSINSSGSIELSDLNNNSKITSPKNSLCMIL